MTIATMQSLLQTYLAHTYPDRHDMSVQNLQSLNVGWESDVYAFDACWDGQERCEPLILRIYPGEDAYAKSGNEFRNLGLLGQAGYPVPRVDLLERDASPFGRPFLIMERIDGVTLWGPLFNVSREQTARLMPLFCGLFARLHAIDWRSAVPDPSVFEPGGPHSVIDRQLAQWEPFIQAADLPGFKDCWEWLLDHRREGISERASLVHWDFHPENILLKADGSGVVIDWTGLEITDYRFDVAWTLLLIGSHQGMEWREPLLAEYERQAGHKVEGLAYFEAAGAVRRLFSVIGSMRYGAQKLGMRPGAEETMRRQAPALRKVYTLLQERTGQRIPEVEQFFDENGA